jgi:hypothetical protein
MIVISAADQTAASSIATNMRREDLNEIQAIGVPDPHEALCKGMAQSKPECYVASVKEVPIAMFGVVPFDDEPKFGSIWLLGTDQIKEVPISFLKKSRKVLPAIIEPYEMVCNVVDKRNEVHIKWIKWLGFSFIRETICGPENRPFYEFARLN